MSLCVHIWLNMCKLVAKRVSSACHWILHNTLRVFRISLPYKPRELGPELDLELLSRVKADYDSTVDKSVTYTKERPIGAIGAVRARACPLGLIRTRWFASRFRGQPTHH